MATAPRMARHDRPDKFARALLAGQLKHAEWHRASSPDRLPSPRTPSHPTNSDLACADKHCFPQCLIPPVHHKAACSRCPAAQQHQVSTISAKCSTKRCELSPSRMWRSRDDLEGLETLETGSCSSHSPQPPTRNHANRVRLCTFPGNMRQVYKDSIACEVMQCDSIGAHLCQPLLSCRPSRWRPTGSIAKLARRAAARAPQPSPPTSTLLLVLWFPEV